MMKAGKGEGKSRDCPRQSTSAVIATRTENSQIFCICLVPGLQERSWGVNFLSSLKSTLNMWIQLTNKSLFTINTMLLYSVFKHQTNQSQSTQE